MPTNNNDKNKSQIEDVVKKENLSDTTTELPEGSVESLRDKNSEQTEPKEDTETSDHEGSEQVAQSLPAVPLKPILYEKFFLYDATIKPVLYENFAPSRNSINSALRNFALFQTKKTLNDDERYHQALGEAQAKVADYINKHKESDPRAFVADLMMKFFEGEKNHSVEHLDHALNQLNHFSDVLKKMSVTKIPGKLRPILSSALEKLNKLHSEIEGREGYEAKKTGPNLK